MSGLTVKVKFSYHCLPVKLQSNSVDTRRRFYVSPTLRLFELSKERITTRLERAVSQNIITEGEKQNILKRLNAISHGGVILSSGQTEHPQEAIVNFLAILSTDLNKAGLPVPQDLPSGEFQKWFGSDVLGVTPEKQKNNKNIIKQRDLSFEVENYKMSYVESVISWMAFVASWSSSIVASLGIAVLCVNPPAALYMFAAAFLLFHADESDEKRWARAGRYVSRVWDGAYYDMARTFFAKSRQRLALLGTVILPVIGLTVSGFTATGLLRAAFQMAARVGVAWMLVSPIGSMTVSAIFVCLAITRSLKALDYDLANKVIPDLITKMDAFFSWGGRTVDVQETRDKKVYAWCEKVGLSFNLKQTDPAAEQREYGMPNFQPNQNVTFSEMVDGNNHEFQVNAHQQDSICLRAVG